MLRVVLSSIGNSALSNSQIGGGWVKLIVVFRFMKFFGVLNRNAKDKVVQSHSNRGFIFCDRF